MKTYKTIRVDCTSFVWKGIFKQDVSAILNKEAADGWEFVSTFTQIQGLIFKRVSSLMVFSKSN